MVGEALRGKRPSVSQRIASVRIFSRIVFALLVGGVLVPLPIAAQSENILEGAPPTRIYVETSYEGNTGRDDCDWYTSGVDLLAALPKAPNDFGTDCRIDIRLGGILNREGAKHFLDLVALLEQTKLQPAVVILDSKGGDTDAALAIARAIRSNEIFKRVENGVATKIDSTDTAVCFSACIVLFAAGYRRSAEFNIYNDPNLPSRLGIHGPGRFDRTTGDYDSSPENRQIMRTKQALKQYFESVGVSTKLVDDMFALAFDDLRLLSEGELRRYGLLDDQT
jgi:hypothetical protein